MIKGGETDFARIVASTCCRIAFLGLVGWMLRLVIFESGDQRIGMPGGGSMQQTDPVHSPGPVNAIFREQKDRKVRV